MSRASRILVIDDEEMIRDIVMSVLAHAGYEVFCAGNGNEGLEILKTQDVDLVVTDILMPEKEGIETIVEIRKSRPKIRIVAVSGGGRANNLHPLQIAGKIGADKTLPKPFEPDELLAMVQGLIGQGSDSQGAEAVASS